MVNMLTTASITKNKLTATYSFTAISQKSTFLTIYLKRLADLRCFDNVYLVPVYNTL